MTVIPNEHPSAQADPFVHEHLPPRDQWPQRVYELPELGLPPQINLVVRLLDEAVEQRGWGDRPLFRSDGQIWTYRQARIQVDRIAHTLVRDLGLVPGNRVLLRGGNSISMAFCWLAVVKAGMVAVATMPLLRAKELTDIIRKSRPSIALCDQKLTSELEMALQGFQETIPLIGFHASPGLEPESERSLEHLMRPHDAPFDACPTSADDIAMMAFTSGTTGKPKAAVHSHRDILAACETWPRHVLKLRSSDIVAGSPPLAFTFGLGGLLIFPLWAGASVYFPSIPYTPESMVQAIQRAQVSVCYTAPTFYRQMAPFAKISGLPDLRISVSAGEGLPDATRQLWKDATGIDIIDGIGATEMFHIFISSAGDAIRRGAIGQVVPGYRAKVVDEDGLEVPRGTIGRLAVIGPTGCRYLDDERQRQYVRHGWNYPGDAFMQDDDGYFFYQARADDMIITSGYNVGGPEVEDALLKHPAVAECGVIGEPDDERGMIVKAFCVLKPGFDPGEDMVAALQNHVKSVLAPYKYPRAIEFLKTLPRTETGKLQRYLLRQQNRPSSPST